MDKLISNQAVINIGTIGHVSHGKSTLVNSITGTKTMRFKQEQEKNLTIKLGYANAKIYKCQKCPRPQCYSSDSSDSPDIKSCQHCKGPSLLVQHVSFVDTPGHEILTATMINGASIMDAAFLLVASNEVCPQPQTVEHLCAIEIMKIGREDLPIMILQNKIDILRKKEYALDNYNQIKTFVKGTSAENSRILPISAQLSFNIDSVCEYLANLKVPDRQYSLPAYMTIIRSFDINRPGTSIDELSGGVIGGTLSQGLLNVGDEIEIRPGIVHKNADGSFNCKPLFTRVVSMYTEQNELQIAGPGGLIGIGTYLDPSLCKSDMIVGNVLGKKGTLPDIYTELQVQIVLLKRLLGSDTKVAPLSLKENLLLNIGALSTGSKIFKLKADLAKIKLTQPVCTNVGEKIAMSRRINGQWRLIGWAKILKGY